MHPIRLQQWSHLSTIMILKTTSTARSSLNQKKKKKKHPLAKDQTQIAKQFLETITRQRKIFCQSPKACNHLMYCVYNSGECIHSSIWTVVN